MSLGPYIETAVQPLQLGRLQLHRRSELSLWNWYSAMFPTAGDWRSWLNDVAGQLLRQPGPSKARVVKTNLIEGAQAAERISFDAPVLGIGRAPENAIVLPESTITRNHARLRREDDSVFLEDLGSAMGTLVNGAKLTPAVPVELVDGDDFVIFPYRFQLEVERNWVADQRVDVSDSRAAASSWCDFGDGCPAGWSVLSLNVEPLEIPAALAADQAFLRHLAARLLAPLESAAEEWQSSNEALIELLLLASLERANRDLAFPFQFSLGRTSRRPCIAEDARGITLSATVELAGVRGAVRLFLPFDLLRGMQESWTRLRPESLSARATWQFPFSVGHVELTTDERDSIELGDVVLYTAEAALLSPGDDRMGYLADWDGAARSRLRKKFDRRLDMPESVKESVTFNDLPLRVQVLIDEHELTLTQAQSLTPGAVLDLDRDPRDPVQLAVNGRIIGTGELVDVEGRLGVRILAWSTR